MTEPNDPREFYAPVVQVQRAPEQDPLLTMRVESREKRHESHVARAIRVNDDPPWLVVDGPMLGGELSHDDVRDWHITCELNVAVAYHWHTQYPPDRQPIEQAAQRGDMDVTAFKA